MQCPNIIIFRSFTGHSLVCKIPIPPSNSSVSGFAKKTTTKCTRYTRSTFWAKRFASMQNRATRFPDAMRRCVRERNWEWVRQPVTRNVYKSKIDLAKSVKIHRGRVAPINGEREKLLKYWSEVNAMHWFLVLCVSLLVVRVNGNAKTNIDWQRQKTQNLCELKTKMKQNEQRNGSLARICAQQNKLLLLFRRRTTSSHSACKLVNWD